MSNAHASITTLCLRDLIIEAGEVVSVLQVIGSPRKAQVVRELCARLTGSVRSRADATTHPVITPPRRGHPMNVDVAKLAAAHFAHSPPGAVVKSDQDGMKFCNQCDRRVTAAFEAACKSKFCSFRK